MLYRHYLRAAVIISNQLSLSLHTVNHNNFALRLLTYLLTY